MAALDDSPCFVSLLRILRIHRCATGDTSPMTSPLRCLTGTLRHIHTHFWQVRLFEFRYKCITKKWFLPFYKRPGQKHNFICCFKNTGQLLLIFLYISEHQGNLAESFFKIAVYLTFLYLIPFKISHMYLSEMSVRMMYPSHPCKTINTPIVSCTSMYP